jgi:hypothetical protein
MTSNIELLHGIRMTIIGDLGKNGFAVLPEFFGQALRHFKRLRDVAKQPENAEAYHLRLRTGRRQAVLIEISHPVPLATDLWVKSVANGYAVADTLEQVSEKFKEYKAASTRDGGSLDDLLELIEKGDVLGAFAEQMRDSASLSEKSE